MTTIVGRNNGRWCREKDNGEDDDDGWLEKIDKVGRKCWAEWWRRCWLVGSTLLPVPSFHHSLIRTNRANVLLNCNVLHSQHFAQLLQYVYSFHGLHSQLYQLRSTVVLYVGWGANIIGNKVFNTLSTDVLISSNLTMYNSSRFQHKLWICISIFHIRAQFYFSPDADAGSNEARQWPSLGRNPRAGELAKDEEMHEAECIHVQCTDSQCTVHIAHIHRSTRSARIQPPHPKLFWSKHSEMGVGCKFEEGTSVEWNSVKFNNHQKPAMSSKR